MFVYSFYIKIQRFSSIGRRSIKIVRGRESGTIFSTLSQRNLNSRSSDIDKTWEKLYSTKIMNSGKKKVLVSVYEKNLFFRNNSYKYFIVFKKYSIFLQLHHHLHNLSMIDFGFHWKVSICCEDFLFFNFWKL